MQDVTTEEQNPEVSPVRYDTTPPVRRGGQGRKVLWFLLILLFLAAVIGGFLFISGRVGKSEEVNPTPTLAPSPTSTPTSQPSPTPTGKPTPTKTPTPTAAKKVTKNLSIRVLNGSGVTGAAKEAGDYLAGLGYEIAGVGNAQTSDFEKITIEIKKEKESLLAQLKIDLQTKYTIGTTSAALSATDSADAVVTVGKK